MAEKLSVDPRTSALLLMDFQTSIVESLGANKEQLLNRAGKLLATARNAGMRVVHVVVGFRPGYPEISARNMTFSAIKTTGRFAQTDPGAAIHASLHAKPDEPVVTKHRVGAFAGTDLDMILRANNIENLIITGISTSGVVLSTVRHAADADYRLIVVGDCCADTDAEVHRVLTEKVFPRQAVVTSAETVIGLLASTG